MNKMFDWNEVIEKGIYAEPVTDVLKRIDTTMYSFVNNYLHEKQYGIQTAHAVAKLMYTNDHEVIINYYMNGSQKLVMLNGGGSSNMVKNLKMVHNTDFNNWSVGIFYEPEINRSIPSAIAIIPCMEIQKKIDYLRKVKHKGKICMTEKGDLYIFDSNVTIEFDNKSDAELVKSIVEGRMV